MEKKRKEIIGYLQTVTDKTNVWCPITQLVQEVLFIDDDELENVLMSLFKDGTLRLGDNFKVALEETINEVLSVNIELGIEGMNEELEKSIKEEDYEKAAQWRDDIEAAELKRK